jgi:hypothetical protein
MESSSSISISEDDDEVHFEDWIINLNIGRVQGVHHTTSSDLPTQYFCLISLLLEGTAVEYGSTQLTHRCTEPDSPAQPPAFSIEPLRSTELCAPAATADPTSNEDGPPLEPQQAHAPAQKSAAGAPSGARRAAIIWDESFTLGASHPDLCLGRAADAAFAPAADADADALDEDEVAGHAELRPPLRGQALLLLLTVHAIDPAGTVAPRWQARAPSSPPSMPPRAPTPPEARPPLQARIPWLSGGRWGIGKV